MKPSEIQLIYVAGPFGPTLDQRAKGLSDASAIAINKATADQYAIMIARSGYLPVTPHTNTGNPCFLDLPAGMSEAQRKAWWYLATIRLMLACDVLFLVPSWTESEGAIREAALWRHHYPDRPVWWGGMPPCSRVTPEWADDRRGVDDVLSRHVADDLLVRLLREGV